MVYNQRTYQKLILQFLTLNSIINNTDRKDALYGLCGYYIIDVKTMDDKIFFLNALRFNNNYQLFEIILKDLSQFKNFFRQKDLVDNILSMLSSVIFNKLSKTEEEKFKHLLRF